MTKPKQKLENIELITQRQISLLVGVSRSKINWAARVDSWKFPKPATRLAYNELAYNRDEVLAWLAENDLKNMPLPFDKHKLLNTQPETRSNQIDNTLAVAFISHKIGSTLKPPKPNRNKPAKTTVVRLTEHNDYTPPSPSFTRQSGHDMWHRVLLTEILV